MAKAFVNRMWAHFLGRGFVNPVDDFGPHNQPSHPELLDQLAKDFRESGYDVKKLCRWIMASRAYQLSSIKAKGSEKDESLFTAMPLKPMTPEQLFDSLLTATLAHKAGSGDDGGKKRDAWMRQFLFAFANDEAEEGTSFQGTIPQALMMMNGELMQAALSGKPGSFLGEVVEQAAAPGPVARELHDRFPLSGRPEPASDRQGADPVPAVSRSVPRQPPGAARPVLGFAEFQRVHPHPLRSRPTGPDPRPSSSRRGAVEAGRPDGWRSAPHVRLCDPFGQMTRRHWMGHLASTALGVPAIQFFSSLQANAQQLRKSNRSIIVLWMGGGPSHLDIWDLKPDSEKNGGPFKPIDTSAPGVKITEHLPKVAKQMQHLSILRSLDSKEGNHDRGTYLMHTGYAPNPTVMHPGFGSYCALELGERLSNFDLPHCISINSPGVGAGFLGHVLCPVRGAEPQRPDRQPEAAQGRRGLAAAAAAHHARAGREPIRDDAARPGRRRSQGGLRQDAADDEFPLSRRLQPRQGEAAKSATPTAGARSARAA